jgi:hypothetical protein
MTKASLVSLLREDSLACQGPPMVAPDRLG